MKNNRKKNRWLTGFVGKRKERLRRGEIDASVIIPVEVSVSAAQKVMPGSQAMEFLSKARTIAQKDCLCRIKVKGCDSPVNVCIVLNKRAEDEIGKGTGKRISVKQAGKILDKTAKAGLVHLCLYNKGHDLYAICSCCPCCCHDLRAMLDFGVSDMVIESDYVVKYDKKKCINCGKCVERCSFGAFYTDDGRVEFDKEKCFGCGLCVTTCTSGASVLIKRKR